MRHQKVLIMTLALIGLTACGDGEQAGQQGQGDKPPPAVTVLEVGTTDVSVREDYAGRVRGAREVHVRARVEGVLEERLYEEGSLVEEGESLFRIDPRPFEVALQAARAERETARANLNQAEREWNRIARLYEQNAVSERERDTAQSAFETSQAAVAVAESEVERAELELGYTRVEAPVTGITDLETQSEGNLIERGAELTRITQLNPVHVRFSLPEDDAMVRNQARQAMKGDGDGEHSRSATLILPDGTEYPEAGEIDFTASTIDAETGTVTARAVFPNDDHRIVPGQFARVRVELETLEDVVTIPARAISDGPEGLQVFVIDGDDKARARPVEAGRTTGDRRVILDGLEAGDRVVVNGMAGIREPGMKVKVEDEKGDTDGEAG